MTQNIDTDSTQETIQYSSLTLAQSTLVMIFLGVSGWYMFWRTSTFNPHAPILSYAVYATEAWFALSVLLHLFMVWRLSIRSPPAPESGKSVDVFVTTYNEPLSMVRRTLNAAVAMDYPHQVWLLDDGNRVEMRALAREVGCRYLARAENTHAKAGNLNNGLRHSSAEFVAIFDCDHVPNKSFLTKTLGYFRNEAVAFVQCPQSFYNLDSFQNRGKRSFVWGEQALFFRVIQRGKDYLNSTMFVGTTAILRRKALDSIGGIATGTVAEDLHTTIRLQRQGWDSVYHDEALAFGLAAPSFRTYVRQRLRWGQGGMQVWRTEALFLGRGFTFAQRVSNLASVLTYFDAWPRLFLYALPGIVLSTGHMPIISLNLVFVAHFLPYYLLHLWVFEEVARGYGNSLYVEEYNLVRSFTFAISTLSLFRRKIPFRVSDKQGGSRVSEAVLLVPLVLTLLWALTGLGVGFWLWPIHNELTLDAFIANSAWTVLVMIIGSRAISFTLFRHQKRRDYRFEIPAPASLNVGGVTVYGVARDISSSGVGIRLIAPSDIRAGEEYDGHIYIPEAIIPFRGRVAHCSIDKPTTIGMEILWPNNSPPKSLEHFLYSSLIQWRINSMSDRVRPPIEWLTNLLWRRASMKLEDFTEKCEPLLTDDGLDASVIGLITSSKNMDFAVVRQKLNERRPVHFWHPGISGGWIDGRVTLAQEYADLAHDGLYVYRVTPGLEIPGEAANPLPVRLALQTPGAEMQRLKDKIANISQRHKGNHS